MKTNGVVNEAFEETGTDLSKEKDDTNVSIVWKNIHYQVNDWNSLNYKKKTILNNVSGYFKTGTLNAILGSSGTGKTTLLNILSGSQCSNTGGLHADSQVYVQPKSATSYFISQHVHENIIGELTIQQILQYAFAFKNGPSDKLLAANHITQIMSTLMLPEKLLDQPFSRCSGGEQRRIAIAQELMALTAPNFLFLDEPSTGLDSVSAYETMRCLQHLAKRQHITVICSIHAPNQETLYLFDQLYVLAKSQEGGVCIFTGSPSYIQPFLQSNFPAAITNTKSPPIETLIKIACNGNGRANSAILKLNSAANSSILFQIFQTLQYQPSLQPQGLPNLRKSFHLNDVLLQTARLFRVTFIARYRAFLLSIILFTIYISLLSSLFSPTMTESSGCTAFDAIQNQTCEETIKEETLLKENATFLAQILIYTGVVTICTSAVVFGSIVKVFRSEHRNHWYSLGAFYCSAITVSFIELFIHALLTASLGYFLPSQHAVDNYHLNWNRFGHYVFFMWLLCFYMQSMGHLVGIILVDHVQLAVIVSVIYHTGATMINGFFVDTEQTGSVFLIEISNLVAFKFIARGILYTFYGIDRCNWEKEFSVMFQFFHVDVNLISMYVMRVLLNILTIRLLTLLVMFLKFGNFNIYSPFAKRKATSKLNNCTTEKSISNHKEQNDYEIITVKKLQNGVNKAPEKKMLKNKILIAWRNLSLFADSSLFEMESTNAQRKRILCNLNGQFHLNTLCGILGTSGAGKSSLLKVLNGQMKSRLSAETEIYQSTFSGIRTCFITQEVSGHLLSGLTCRQSLLFASRFKNGQASNANHKAIARKWLTELGLEAAANTKVEHCSGGERQRLALGLELTALQMPNLALIDEGTSNLDSYSAEIVIRALRRLTIAHPLAIVVTIHQPTVEVLTMFDQLYVLSRGGKCIYSGGSTSEQMQQHLSSAVSAEKSTAASSSVCPIEVLIRHSCSSADSNTVQRLVSQNNLQWEASAWQLSRDTQLTPDGVQQNRVRFSLYSVYISFLRYFVSFQQHLWKEYLFISINYLFYGITISLFYDNRMAMVNGCINLESDFNVLCSRDAQGMDVVFQLLNNFKYTFFFANFFMIFVLLQQALSFHKELEVFKNEHRNGWYSSGAFYLTKSIFELLTLLPTILLYVYLGRRLLPGIYWNIVFLFIITTVAFQSQGQIFAILARGNISMILILAVSVFLFSVLLSNFLLLTSRLSAFYLWLSNFAITRFLFEAFMLLKFGFGRCGSNEIQVLLYVMNLSDDDYYHRTLMLLFNMVLYRCIAFYLFNSKVEQVENRRERLARIEKHCKDLKVVNII